MELNAIHQLTYQKLSGSQCILLVQFHVQTMNISGFITFFSKINVNSLIIGVFAVILAYNQFKANQNKIDSGTIQAYKDQLEITEKRNKDDREAAEKRQKENQEKIQELGKEVAGIKATLIEKDKQLTEYKEIFQGRDPALKGVLDEILLFMKKMDTRLGLLENK